MVSTEPQFITHDGLENEKVDTVGGAEVSQHEDAETYSVFTPAEQKKIIRRVDARLVVTCGVMFCFSLMDRSNLGAASIAGMSKDMQLIEYRYVGTPQF